MNNLKGDMKDLQEKTEEGYNNIVSKKEARDFIPWLQFVSGMPTTPTLFPPYRDIRNMQHEPVIECLKEEGVVGNRSVVFMLPEACQYLESCGLFIKQKRTGYRELCGTRVCVVDFLPCPLERRHKPDVQMVFAAISQVGNVFMYNCFYPVTVSGVVKVEARLPDEVSDKNYFNCLGL